ncbi:hypothetical protein C8R44DRAFT_872296 [Mycena epipterygia]|nr:hypothetical protein C8R44DRAFT_872296 [Mycena epipterygia]
MFAGITALAPSHLPTTLPPSHLPEHFTVPQRAPSAPATGPPSYSTHTLAIAPAGKNVGGPHATFPVRAVLADHCASRVLPPRTPTPRYRYRLPSPSRKHSPFCMASCAHAALRPPSPPSAPSPARVSRFSGATLGRRARRDPLGPRLRHRAPHPRRSPPRRLRWQPQRSWSTQVR